MSKKDDDFVEAAGFAAGGAAAGAGVAATVGGMGLAVGGTAVAIGAAPVVAAGTVVGLSCLRFEKSFWLNINGKEVSQPITKTCTWCN